MKYWAFGATSKNSSREIFQFHVRFIRCTNTGKRERNYMAACCWGGVLHRASSCELQNAIMHQKFQLKSFLMKLTNFIIFLTHFAHSAIFFEKLQKSRSPVFLSFRFPKAVKSALDLLIIKILPTKKSLRRWQKKRQSMNVNKKHHKENREKKNELKLIYYINFMVAPNVMPPNRHNTKLIVWKHFSAQIELSSMVPKVTFCLLRRLSFV